MRNGVTKPDTLGLDADPPELGSSVTCQVRGSTMTHGDKNPCLFASFHDQDNPNPTGIFPSSSSTGDLLFWHKSPRGLCTQPWWVPMICSRGRKYWLHGASEKLSDFLNVMECSGIEPRVLLTQRRASSLSAFMCCSKIYKGKMLEQLVELMAFYLRCLHFGG